MSNFYSDIMNEFDDTNIDDELFDLETDFAKSTVSESPIKQTLSKSDTNIFDDNKTNIAQTSSKNFDWLTDTERPATTETRKSTPSRRAAVRFSSDSIGDDINMLGLEDTKPKTEVAGKSKKENILNELFGKNTSTKLSANDKEISFSAPKVDLETPVLKNVANPQQDKGLPVNMPKTETSSILGNIGTRKRTERRNSNLLDPLGLFSSPKKTVPQTDKSSTEIEQNIKPPVKETSNGLPDWLAENTRRSKSAPSVTVETNISANAPASTDVNTTKTPQDNVVKTTPISPVKSNLTIKDHTTGKTSTTISTEDTLAQLHQQEAQLLLAMQLKKFEEKLFKMETFQREALSQQNQQLQTLLKEQSGYQRLLDEQITSQQERINEHLHMLLISPSLPIKSESNVSLNYSSANVQQNSQVDKIWEIFKEKFSNELSVLENSYKKQVALLEESLIANEDLLKSEIMRVTQYYQKKVETLENEVTETETKYNDKISQIRTEYNTEIERISNHYKQMIEVLNSQHLETVEHIRKTKLVEANIITENFSFANLLKEALEKFETKTANIEEIQNILKNQFDLQIATKEAELKSKENELKLLLQKTENQNKILENDRNKLMSLVESLETRLNEQTVASKEAEWEFKNREARLAARETALDRETERLKELTEREKKQIELMRQEAIAENEKLNEQIKEARLSLAAEKSRFETEEKLKGNYDDLKTRVEVEAAIDAAQKAAKVAEQERERLLEERRKLEQERRDVQSKERNLKNRELELNDTLAMCERKKEEASRMLHESKLLELKYNEQLKTLQNQLASLRVRERKLAEEKVNISKERIALHKGAGEMCPTCATGVNSDLHEKVKNELGLLPAYMRNSIDIELNKIKYSEDVEK